MRLIRFSYHRSAMLGCVLAACMAVVSSPGSADVMLHGTGKWDPAVVQMYFKYLDNLDISSGPGNYPYRQMLTGLTQNCHNDDGTKYTVTNHVNAEFAKRVDVLMAVYRAAGGKDVGLVPCTGALRSYSAQLELFKKGRHDPAGPNGNTPIPQWVQNDPKAKCPSEGGMVTCVTDSWHMVGLAVDFGQVTAAGKYTTLEAFVQEDAWRKVLRAMTDLGMLSGSFYRSPDRGHVEWYPNLLEPADAGALGTVTTKEIAGYAWKFPSTVYLWIPNPQNPANGDLKVIDFGSDGNWITVKDERTITTSDGGWSGLWYTYKPAVKIFPAYIPTVRLQNWQKVDHPLAVSAVTAVELKSYGTSEQGSKQWWKDETGSLECYPAFDVADWQNEADVAINEARRFKTTSQAYRDAVKPWKFLRAKSYYDVSSIYGMTGPGHPSAWKSHRHVVNAEGEDITGPPDAGGSHEGVQLGGPTFDLGWNRVTGEVGFPIGLNEKGVYRLESTMQVDRLTKHPINDNVQSSKLPAGATDKTEPPNWPF